MLLSSEDMHFLSAGAIFNASSVNPDWCEDALGRALAHMDLYGVAPELLDVSDIDPNAAVVAVGFVNNGQSLSELRPVGDEFSIALDLISQAIQKPIRGIIPLAAGSVNAIVPFLVGMQVGLPVINADPMGRVFPLLSQTLFNLANLPAGPIAAVGALGESAVIRLDTPSRAEKLARALAREFGGWAATASYPMSAETLARTGVIGSLSKLIEIGRTLLTKRPAMAKRMELRRKFGVQSIVRARVTEDAWVARPGVPSRVGTKATVVLNGESRGEIIQLEVQSEILMVLSDGAIRATSPDIISLLNPVDCSVASVQDLRCGNLLDICILPAASPWYSPNGRNLSRRPELQVEYSKHK